MADRPSRPRRGLTLLGVVVTVVLLAILAATTNVELYDPMATDSGTPAPILDQSEAATP